MAEKVKQALIKIVKIGFAVLLIWWLVREGAFDFNILKRLATPGFLGMGALLLFINLFLNNLRWLALLKGQGFDTTVRRTLPLTYISLFFSFAIPGGVGGDVVKGYYVLREHPQQKLAAAVSIFMDRMIGMFVMILMAVCALLLNLELVEASRELTALGYALIVLFGCFVVFFGVALSRRLSKHSALVWFFKTIPGGGRLRQIYDSVHAYRNAPKSFFLAIGLSLASQALIVAFVMMVGQMMEVTEVPASGYFFLVPIGLVAMAIPIAPAGIGVGQTAFYFLFNLYLGKESQLGPTAVTSFQIMQFLWSLLGAYFYLQRRRPEELGETARPTSGAAS